MSELLKAARLALPGLEWDDEGDFCASWVLGKFVSIKTTSEGFVCMFDGDRSPWFASAGDGLDWIWRQLRGCRDVLNTALGEGWIPVGERLPEDGQSIIVFDTSEGHGHAQFAPWESDPLERWHVCNAGSERYFFHVTHWMPLPAPPKTP